jgi:hypothetical protein
MAVCLLLAMRVPSLLPTFLLAHGAMLHVLSLQNTAYPSTSTALWQTVARLKAEDCCPSAMFTTIAFASARMQLSANAPNASCAVLH